MRMKYSSGTDIIGLNDTLKRITEEYKRVCHDSS